VVLDRAWGSGTAAVHRRRSGGFRSDNLGPRHPHVDYYVVRLWEDLIGLTPMVMQPVPNDLELFINVDLPDRPDLDDDEEAWSAMIWHGTYWIWATSRTHPAFAPGAP
jgi:hypothetical protein